jgi:hypothetical protein
MVQDIETIPTNGVCFSVKYQGSMIDVKKNH